MTAARFLDWYLLAALAGQLLAGSLRAATSYARGVPVLALDRQRTGIQLLCDLLLLSSLCFWAYLVVGSCWPLPTRMLPGWLDQPLFDGLAVKSAGAVLVAGELVCYLLALSALGPAWRLGIDRKTPAGLVTGGIFSWTRNPIYLSFDLLFLGTFLMQGRPIFLLLGLWQALLLHDQILREERFLAAHYGAAYGAYRSRVGRYATFPGGRSSR